MGARDDNQVVSDAMTLSMQSAAYVASVGHRLIVKSHEVEVLRAQLVAEQNLVEDCQRVIRSLKRERANLAEANRHQLEILQEENQKLLKMVDFYSQYIQKQLEALDQPGKRKHRDQDISYAPKGVIFGSSSDEPHETMCENPRGDPEGQTKSSYCGIRKHALMLFFK
ncbi:hypothetical protein L3X38_010367 [Prunus dulcis]|uniref:Uncharacterized protein n=1 Tax=Prunus dulcis TaxID=3755 RepID=A0AAD4WHN0_PRUDU|nr:hypothetical protein L3X38_010367 [Prunus dulcis]